MVRRFSVLAVLALLLVAASGCSGADKVADAGSYTAVIDVRTPAEYASGHVAGARNIDVQDPGFDNAIAALPKDGTYLVYCRSGNRSAAAIKKMQAIGLTATNGGGLGDMTDRGYQLGS